MAPQAATLPNAPLTHSHARKSAAARRREVPTEERVSILETRAESMASVADVKAEVRGAENRLILWILGAAVALAGFFFSNTARLDTRMDKLEERLDTRIDKLDTKLDSLMAELVRQRERGQ